MSESPSPARVPIEPGYFSIPEHAGEPPRLLGSKCKSCGEVFFPRRIACAKCLQRGTEDVLLGPRGTLYTWTYCHIPLFGKLEAKVAGYGVGQIDLPEGPRIQAVLLGGRDELSIGLPVRLDLEVVRTTDDGDEIVTFRFAPVVAGSGAAS